MGFVVVSVRMWRSGSRSTVCAYSPIAIDATMSSTWYVNAVERANRCVPQEEAPVARRLPLKKRECTGHARDKRPSILREDGPQGFL